MSANKYQTNMERMQELIALLTKADIAYYRDDNPIMSDFDYDKLTDELKDIESRTGLVLSGSPTQKVSGEILESLTEVRHTKPMLSADKTKSVDDLIKFASKGPVLLSWKMDGLTLVLRYENGELKQAITRGREGIIGEDVTHTVRTFLNVPLTIPTKDSFEVRGEGVISWANFEKINSSLEEPYCRKNSITDGTVGMRSLLDWIVSSEITGDVYQSALYTVISKATADEVDREALISSVLEPIFALKRRRATA